MKHESITHCTRFAGLVKRYACWPTLREQNVGEHTWQIMRTYCEVFGMPRAEVWYYMLHHDSAELMTGDIPFPVKALNPILKVEMDRLEDEANKKLGIVLPELTPEEKLRVKVCDLYEMWQFGYEEFQKGNKFCHPVMERTWQRINELLRGSDDLGKVRAHMRRYDGWSEV